MKCWGHYRLVGIASPWEVERVELDDSAKVVYVWLEARSGTTFACPDSQTMQWAALLQHYGAPTPLVDWTYSDPRMTRNVRPEPYGTPVRFTNATNRGSSFIPAKKGALFANVAAADRSSTARENHMIDASVSPSCA